MAETSSKLKQKNIMVSEDDENNCREEKDNELGLGLEKLSLGKKKKLLVLSLGGLLFHRVCRKRQDKMPQILRYPDASYGSFIVYKRPFSEDFLKFCFERFEVGLWSSAREWYVDNALDCLMTGLRQKLAFIWDQKKCIDSGFKCLENEQKPIYLKNLSLLWENKDHDLPWSEGKYSAADTLMIDDEPYKSAMNPPYTAVFLAEYHANDIDDKVLAPNGELRMYLDGVAEADNVPEYVEKHPFGLPESSSPNLMHLYSLVSSKMNE